MQALTILGNNSALPAHGRHPTAQLLHWNSRAFLIDCGEGTQMQMMKYRVGWGKISHIFISHLHGDHCFGLPGLLNSMNLQNRLTPLHLFAPKGIRPILDAIWQSTNFSLKYPLHIYNIEGDSLLIDDEEIEVRSFAMDHRVPTTGFFFREKKLPRKVKAEVAQKLEIPFALYRNLQEGKDIRLPNGKQIKNGEITFAADEAISYAYCADTKFLPNLQFSLPAPSVMYHEATFLNAMSARAAERYHSTAAQAAQTAQNCGARKLLLGHYSSQYQHLEDFLLEAREIFPESYLSEEGETYDLKKMPASIHKA